MSPAVVHAPTEKKTANAGPTAVFGKDRVVSLECGRKVRVTKWSVRKAMAMAKALSDLLKKVFAFVEREHEAGGPGGKIRAADVIAMIPTMIDECAKELSYVVAESLVTEDGKPQLSPDEVLDVLTVEDFGEVLGEIIELNINERMLGKWMRLFQNLPMVRAKEPSI